MGKEESPLTIFRYSDQGYNGKGCMTESDAGHAHCIVPIVSGDDDPGISSRPWNPRGRIILLLQRIQEGYGKLARIVARTRIFS